MFADTSYNFFTLPAELRIKVYKMCMVDHDDNILRLIMPDVTDVKNRSAALLRTCRAIYEETMPILYGNQVLRIQFEGNLRECLESMSAAARANIKEISIMLKDCSRDNHGFPGPYYKLQRGVLIREAADKDALGLLQGLKRITFHCYMKWTKCGGFPAWWGASRLKRPPHETFLESMIAAEIKQDHGLRTLMQQLRHHEHIQWQLELSSCEYYFGTQWVQIRTVQVKAKIGVKRVGPSAEQWIVEKIAESTSDSF